MVWLWYLYTFAFFINSVFAEANAAGVDSNNDVIIIDPAYKNLMNRIVTLYIDITTVDAAGNVITSTSTMFSSDPVTAPATTPVVVAATTTPTTTPGVIAATTATSSSSTVAKTASNSGGISLLNPVSTIYTTTKAGGGTTVIRQTVTPYVSTTAVINSQLQETFISVTTVTPSIYTNPSQLSALKAASGSSGTGSTTTHYTGTKPDPSTDMTTPPVSSVTNLSMDPYVTITQGTTKTFTTTRGRTSIWVTVVDAGFTLTVQTTFAQRFSSQYKSVAEPSSGSVGLGSIKGTVGVVKHTMTASASASDTVAKAVTVNAASSLSPYYGYSLLFILASIIFL
ncbi:hypothetical protein Kpol_1038p15 [Vanderwaltozyma polyspora DSM 70294]|uniref:Uncharacterized protein n=1 Tax=Vanderwaltozyma polyspora (strain ATCC 22028 / DSM 70294 / BCRC 21397 / CBS 2163 / NBRC 10782 / NRRL Y-8283 / UCD 57-17) TaxID=436907 RepID=A7TR06_VANPO|nr:uncharacterized protein Kpol_1038p15 [Vanderwaltozyma polyspora DSM 70294]EDO15309.1 hypothetical protein Kpol_1038p15 [Vanderwaltozyma polyspora DSM 70294]